jgi:hypothetical protein
MNPEQELCFCLPVSSCLFLLTVELSAYFQLFSIKFYSKKWLAKVLFLFLNLQALVIFFSNQYPLYLQLAGNNNITDHSVCLETIAIQT